MNSIDLNCDMGEGLDNDALLMPFISSANIACGYHAGDENSMQRTVDLCLQHSVSIGAHPGFADKANFGRTAMQMPLQEVYDLVADQIQLLQKMTNRAGAKLHHVKPHGALYNMAAKDAALANAIAKAVRDIDPHLIFFGLSGSYLISEAEKLGLQTASEVFADRTYLDDGSLTPRSEPNAIIETEEGSVQQVLKMIVEKTVTSINHKKIPIKVETICLHGDGKHALQFAKKISDALQQNHIQIKQVTN
jgi:UPF0271 protein